MRGDIIKYYFRFFHLSAMSVTSQFAKKYNKILKTVR